VSLAVSGCGGGSAQDANEPTGSFAVEVTRASWQPAQRLAERTHMVITVRNAGTKMIPNLAVTIVDPTLKYPTSAQAFGQNLSGGGEAAGLASTSRPVWIIDGPGGAVTAYANTWALGPLQPNQSATFQWTLTATKPGSYVIQYQVAAGLNGKARAVLQSGGRPWGTFHVRVSSQPARSYVNNAGQVVKLP
jgi:hypothetical protein